MGGDVLFGGTGTDVLFGMEGDDLLMGGEGGDVLYGDGCMIYQKVLGFGDDFRESFSK